jgi:peroxiredoxin
MFQKLTLLLVVIAFLASCSGPERTPNVTIAGSFPELTGERVYLEELEPLDMVMIDSVEVNPTGAFHFDLYVDDAGFYVLRTQRENNLLLLLARDEQVTIRSSGGGFDPFVEIIGSSGSNDILSFEKFMDVQRQRIDSLGMAYEAVRGGENFIQVKRALDSLYLTFVQDQRNYVIRFVEDHPGSLATLILINRNLGQTKVIDEEKDYLYLYYIDSLLQVTHPGNKHTVDHHDRVLEIKGRIFDQYVIEEKLRPGKRAPDVVLNDTSGQPVSLKSYTGQKVILYFWAGWNAQSRADNRRLVKVYPGLRQKNTEILGISLDENEIVWKGAIRLDGLQWPQLSDLKGLYSDVKRSYNIPDELPFYYLVDEHQKIEYKHARLDSLLRHMNR